jgi:tRNA nucleotidyltransferase (CCA-adding enzyme)
MKILINESIIRRLNEESENLKMNVPSDIKVLAKQFNRNGHDLFIVGGAVRDLFYGKEPKDYDLATDANPDRVIEILEKEGYDTIIPKGKSFGVISVIINGEEYEIATFREDGEYKDGRRPESIKFANIDSDVKRRDLTINALYYDITKDKVIDLVGGVDDIKSGQIRTVGNAEDRFNEDRIRILRAIRFAAITNSDLNPDIKSAVQSNNSLKGVSFERIRDEFLKGLSKAKSTVFYLNMIKDLDLFPQIFPDLKVNYDFIEYKNPEIIIATLLLNNSPELVSSKLNNYKYTSKEAYNISTLISLKNLSAENAPILKRKISKVIISDNDLRYFLNEILGFNESFSDAFIKFQLSLSGDDVAKEYNVKGKELGEKINQLETENFLKLIK